MGDVARTQYELFWRSILFLLQHFADLGVGRIPSEIFVQILYSQPIEDIRCRPNSTWAHLAHIPDFMAPFVQINDVVQSQHELFWRRFQVSMPLLRKYTMWTVFHLPSPIFPMANISVSTPRPSYIEPNVLGTHSECNISALFLYFMAPFAQIQVRDAFRVLSVFGLVPDCCLYGPLQGVISLHWWMH